MMREVRNRQRAIVNITFRGQDFEIETEDDLSKIWMFLLQRVGMEDTPGRLIIGAIAEEDPRIGESCDRIHDNLKDLDLRRGIS